MKKIIIILISVLFVNVAAEAVKMKDLKIYINPGHGGHDSDDRPQTIYPFASGDPEGYWESNSNLVKGLLMYNILDSIGAKPYLSRTTNTTADDRDLSGIAKEANTLKADLLFSIHTNAGESVNYPLMLYREEVIGTPRYPESIDLSNLLWKNLHSSKLSLWTRDNPYVAGDLTFYEGQWTGGLGVLRTLYIVGLLSEGGMHEHRPEAHRLMNHDFCWLEAWHFVRTVMEYFNTEDRFVTGNVAGVIYDDHNIRESVMPWKSTAYGRDKNAPVNGAYIELRDNTGKVIQKRTTDNMYNGLFVFRNVAPGNYKLVVTHNDFYSSSKDVTVTANEVTYNDIAMSYKRESPLVVESYSPSVTPDELVSCVMPIVINFNHDVVEESFKQAFKIEPVVDGEITFSNSFHTATFKPVVAFDSNVKYTVTLSKDVKTPDKVYTTPNLASELSFSFSTQGRNRLDLIQSFPEDAGQIHYEASALEFRFDKKLYAKNIYDQITIYDKDNNIIPINKRSSSSNKLTNGYGNVIIVLNGNLNIGQQYKVVLDGTIKDVDGIPLTDTKTFNFKAVNEGETKEGKLIDGFETKECITYDAQNSLGIKTEPVISLNSSKLLFDKASIRISYDFINHKDGVLVTDYVGGIKTVTNGQVIGIHVYGDLNNHELYLGFTAGTDTKYEKVCNLNFLGWKYLEFKLTTLENNVNYSFSNVKLIQSDALYAQKGGFQLDNLIAREPSGVENNIVEGIEIYPNPASDKVTVSGINNINSLELFNMQGGLVKVNYGNEMSVTDFTAGVYMLRINTSSQSFVKRIIIK
ncbi:MAG: T9SS type A sorting domain-containing protein [Muribaculaceae bacterium]